jgi:hypothetical protein
VKRQRWKKYQHRIAPQRLVFIDETWVKTNMAPLRGWDHRGDAWWPCRSAVRQATHMIFLPPMALISIPSNSCSQTSAITCERHNRGLSIMAKGGENPRPLLTN